MTDEKMTPPPALLVAHPDSYAFATDGRTWWAFANCEVAWEFLHSLKADPRVLDCVDRDGETLGPP